MLKMLWLVAFTLGALCSPGFAAPPDDGPKAQIQRTVDAIIEQLRTLPAENSTRRQAISTLIRAKFDFEIMAQGALGRNWNSATAEQQQHFIALFSGLLEETYLGRIQAYTDEKISYGDEQIRKNRAEVNTFIHTANAAIPITYKLLPRDRDWLVYDVVIEEVSLIRNYRSSYDAILRSKGMAGLLEEMQVKLEELRQRNAAASEAPPQRADAERLGLEFHPAGDWSRA